MNKLSWLLYAASAFDGLRTLAIVGASVTGAAIGVWWMVCLFNAIEGNGGAPKPLSRLYGFVLMFAVIAAVLPDATTMYLIAGSEAGQTVVSSEIGQKVMVAVERAIESYTKKGEGK